MPLKISKEELTSGQGMVALKGGGMVTHHVYGIDSSMMFAERSPGYHSRPHIHAAEQLNYVLEGDIWIFIEDRAFHVKAGDFIRIPSMVVHWAWNRSETKPCTFIQSFAPAHEINRPGSVGLLDDGEKAPDMKLSRNYMVSDEYMKIAEAKLAEVKK